MSKAQKSLFKTLKKDSHRQAFVQMLEHQQDNMGKFKGWRAAYAKKCARKGVEYPFE